MTRLVEVALALPLFRAFTYAVPAAVAHRVAGGTRVVVPFRNRKQVGIVLGDAERPDPTREYKEILEAPDAEPALDASMLQLSRWIAGYYAAPLGVVVRSALPALLTGAARPVPPRRSHRVVRIRDDMPTLMQRDAAFRRAPRQRVLFELLESLGGAAPVEHLTRQLDFSSSVLDGLVRRGLVAVERVDVDRDPFAARALTEPQRHAPTPAQRAAIEAITAGGPGASFLLHGITGSGKTLVYLEVLRKVVIERGKSAIVLVPEIALTPQTVDRFRAVFGDRVAVLHSALSDGERYDAWRALRRGERTIAVGARSAVFAPLANLGAIIVDEEHESSYKQAESPRYHAREVAIVRARQAGAVVVLGSATPSLESWSNAIGGRYQLLRLPDRVGGGALPRVRVVDLRERLGASAPATRDPFRQVVSGVLEEALRDRLGRKEQSILLLNRRGFSAFVQCTACGDVAVCPDCSISLTYHRLPERLVCHYCQHHEPVREQCARCGAQTLRRRGMGTQQVEALLAERFPAARIARMDVDTTSGKWAHSEILDRVGAGEVDMLLGTQMIAKGLDFPNVTLVGVIDADVGINLPDFRASERCFQLLAQVGGRAGRGPRGGEVFIQTRLPEHHAVRCAITHDYLTFVGEELAGRRDPPYPPESRLVNIIVSGLNQEATAALARDAGDWLRALIADKSLAMSVLGPAPCAVERVKSRWRWHVVLRSPPPGDAVSAGTLTRVARYFASRFPVPAGTHRMRVAVDRDPVSLL